MPLTSENKGGSRFYPKMWNGFCPKVGGGAKGTRGKRDKCGGVVPFLYGP